MKVSINKLADYAQRIDAKPLPSDKFMVTLTRAQLQWLQHIVSAQVRSEKAQLEHYIIRDAVNVPGTQDNSQIYGATGDSTRFRASNS